MNDFHFLRPGWFLAVIPLIGSLWSLARRHSGAGDWANYCDAALLPHVLIGTPSGQSRKPLWLAGLTGLLAILALAGPAWERLPSPVFRNLSALVVVLDLSWAMEAADVKPNRLERARFKIDDLLRARKDGQTALLAYAGDAFVVTPLTDDVGTITAQLTALSPRIMPVQGARLDLGLEAAARLLKQAGQKTGDVLVLTAGEEIGSARSTAARLKDEGYRLSLIGVGSRDGAPIPLPEGGFLKNAEGRMVISRLDIKALWDTAQAGGGVYRTLDAGTADTDAVLEFIDRRAEAAHQAGQAVHVDQWQEGGIWLLPPLVLLAALGFRRGWLGLLLLAVLAPLPKSAEALDWRDLWLTPDQQARRALEAGDAKGAAERFKNPAWKAAADYQAGNFAAAAKQLEPLDTPLAQYNRGNALARQGELEQALKAYDRALQLAPGDEDAEYNRKLVEDALKKQQEQSKQDQPSEQSKGEGQGNDQSQPSQKGQEGEAQPDEDERQTEQTAAPGEPPGSEPPEASSTQGAGQPQENPAENPEQTPERAGDDADYPEGHEASSARGNPAAPEPDQPEAASRDAPAGADKEPAGDQPSAVAGTETRTESEQAQAQWLRRIPDDPGGLLKRKFYYQYRLRQQQQAE